MSSIRRRLTLQYAAAATMSSALLLGTGYALLEYQLIHGLDLLNKAEFGQLKAHLGNDYSTLSRAVIDQRIRETSEFGSVLFYIDVDNTHTGLVFTSHNLSGRPIPDVRGRRVYNVSIPEIGEVRVGEFVQVPFDVTVATSLRQVRATMRSYIQVSAGLLVAMLAASVAIGSGLARIVLRPLRDISATATRIGSNNLSARIPAPGNDEIADLARLLNAMFDRLETAFEQIKRFTAEASHELKTPLSLIRLHAERLLENGTLDPSQADAAIAQLEEVARLNQIIDSLLFLSRAEANAVALDFRAIDPGDLMVGIAQDASALAEHEGKQLVYLADSGQPVELDARSLRQVWLNLIINAIQASPLGGTITLLSRFSHNAWSVIVEDEGPGLTDDQLDRVFERFTRFAPDRDQDRGSGLGLAIARSIVGLHHGSVVATRRQDRSGLQVTVTLPLWQPLNA
jgi:signal transduction histidine kinase